MNLTQRLRQATALRNVFMALPVPFLAERMGADGVESLTLDLQHGALESGDLLAMTQAMRAGGALPLARLAWNRPEHIMNALDYGIEGLICPMIESAADAAAFVRAAKYPPLGNRSFGPFRASVHYDGDYFADANARTVCFAMVETAGAVEHLDAIATIPGLGGLYVGPFDLSVSLGLEKRADFADPALNEVLDRVLNLCDQHDLFSGVFTVRTEDARAMAERGFDLVTCGTEELVFRWGLERWKGYEG